MKTLYYIPTRDRAKRQRTLRNMPKGLLFKTYVVCEEDQYDDYVKHNEDIINRRRIIPFPPEWGNFIVDGYGCFSDKKQWILEGSDADYIFFLDDDLAFDYRTGSSLRKAGPQQVSEAFRIMRKWLQANNMAHVALSAREGNNRVEEDDIIVGRAMRVCGFDANLLRKHDLKLNRVQLMADFDITLQLLEMGWPNRILYKYANGQRKSNDKGGCSLYRTPKLMKHAAFALKDLHPKYVKVNKKKTSQPWAGFDTNVRYDVMVYWKNAFKWGRAQKTGIKNFLRK